MLMDLSSLFWSVPKEPNARLELNYSLLIRHIVWKFYLERNIYYLLQKKTSYNLPKHHLVEHLCQLLSAGGGEKLLLN